jgi:hypothetical protein
MTKWSKNSKEGPRAVSLLAGHLFSPLLLQLLLAGEKRKNNFVFRLSAGVFFPEASAPSVAVRLSKCGTPWW